MDLTYWDNYYKTHKHNAINSLFSAFVREEYLKPHTRLLELGCGNGRDSVYFAKSAIATTAIDQVQSEIDYLNAHFGALGCTFVCGDFSELSQIDSLTPPYECIYSRFSLHSITHAQQRALFAQLPRYLALGGILAIETRGYKNSLYQKGERVQDERDAFIYEAHYRRFVDLADLCKEIESISQDGKGFEILYAQESQGFAPFVHNGVQEDDFFIRIIARAVDSLGGGVNRYYIYIIFSPKQPHTQKTKPALLSHKPTLPKDTPILPQSTLPAHKEVA